MDAEGSRKDFRVRCAFHFQGAMLMFGQIGILVAALLAIFLTRFGFPVFARGAARAKPKRASGYKGESGA
jgi:hypothetical protein